MYIEITEEMKKRAQVESQKREDHINHHFNPNHLSGEERNIIGFLGEFAACELLGINWKDNIRSDYLTIDSGDGYIAQGIFDVKTETIPNPAFTKIINHSITDSELYGKRWINDEQVQLLPKYNLVIFGCFLRGDLSKWFPIGYLETDIILQNFSISGGNFNTQVTPTLKVNTSDLKPIKNLVTK